MKIENKIRSLIREEIKKIMLQEKFASSKITNLFKLMSGRDKQFFNKTAATKGFAWSDVEDENVFNSSNSDNSHMNIFIVDKTKKNPYDTGWEGSLYPGIIGITIGKKSMYWPKER